MMRAGYCHTTALSDPSNNQRGIDDQVKLNSTEALLIISVTGMSATLLLGLEPHSLVTFCPFGPYYCTYGSSSTVLLTTVQYRNDLIDTSTYCLLFPLFLGIATNRLSHEFLLLQTILACLKNISKSPE